MASETRPLTELTRECAEYDGVIAKSEAVLASYTADVSAANRKHMRLKAIVDDAAATALNAKLEHDSCIRKRKSQEEFTVASKYRRTQLAKEIRYHPDAFEENLEHAVEDIQAIYGAWDESCKDRLARVCKDLGTDLPGALIALGNYVREFGLTVTFALNPENETAEFDQDAEVILRSKTGDVLISVVHTIDRHQSPPHDRQWDSCLRVLLDGRVAICTGRGSGRRPYSHCIAKFYINDHAEAGIPIPAKFSPSDPNSIPNRLLSSSFLTYLYSWFPHDSIDEFKHHYERKEGERPILSPWEFVRWKAV